MHEMVDCRNENKLIRHLINLTVTLYCSLHFSLIMLAKHWNLVHAVCASHAHGFEYYAISWYMAHEGCLP